MGRKKRAKKQAKAEARRRAAAALVAASAPATGELVPYDKHLLERARTQWQFGEWNQLAALDPNDLAHHPRRARLALLAAAGHQQLGRLEETRRLVRLAHEWGCDRTLIERVLISGVYNTLGRANALAGRESGALRHLETALTVGAPGNDPELLMQTRIRHQFDGGDLPKLEPPRDRRHRPARRAMGVDSGSGQWPPPVRLIHHLACTGGTLISRCIAAQPDTWVLSEVDPLSPFVPGGFLPTDLIGLSRFGSRPADTETQIELFLAGLAVLYTQARRQGEHLVLREHSHGQFHFGEAVPERPTLRAIVQRAYPTRALVTVRHPFDTFLSLQDTGWVQHFSPPTLDEYARRVHAFLDAQAGCPLVRYEDFVAEPAATMQRICEVLELGYNPDFVESFAAIELSGDSGRRGDRISPRPRRAHPPALEQEARASEAFQTLLDRLDYSFDGCQPALQSSAA